MQVDPALPWDNTVEGGTIRLREPLTLQQLLDGALDIVLKDGHGELVEGNFEIYPSDSKLYLGGNSLDYLIANVDTSASSTQYSELILEKSLSADEKLHSVSIHVPEIIASPAFPWPDTGGGTISLKTPVSCQDILDGKIVFVTKDGISYYKTGITEEGNEIHLVTGYSGNYYSIEKFDGTASELTLGRASTQSGTRLWNAVLPQEAKSPILIDGLPFEATQNNMSRILVLNENVTIQEMAENYLDIVITDENQSEQKHATYVNRDSFVDVKYGDVVAFKLRKEAPYVWAFSRNNEETALIVISIAYNQ